ncbi:MAG: hypothetical protein U0136_21140 [Bdellovibrionota bacterium]
MNVSGGAEILDREAAQPVLVGETRIRVPRILKGLTAAATTIVVVVIAATEITMTIGITIVHGDTVWTVGLAAEKSGATAARTWSQRGEIFAFAGVGRSRSLSAGGRSPGPWALVLIGAAEEPTLQ